MRRMHPKLRKELSRVVMRIRMCGPQPEYGIDLLFCLMSRWVRFGAGLGFFAGVAVTILTVLVIIEATHGQ